MYARRAFEALSITTRDDCFTLSFLVIANNERELGFFEVPLLSMVADGQDIIRATSRIEADGREVGTCTVSVLGHQTLALAKDRATEDAAQGAPWTRRPGP
eukprot:scaffold552_cov526-Prasinococcus_capsulatus_cf.AAC.27